VPAYNAFTAHAPGYQEIEHKDPILESKFEEYKINEFKDIPVTTKKNYIKANENHDWETHVHGVIL